MLLGFGGSQEVKENEDFNEEKNNETGFKKKDGS